MDILKTIISAESIHIQWRDFLFNATIGSNGIINSNLKNEGDKKTPTGRHKVIYGYYRPDRITPPKSSIQLHPLHPSYGWCDEPMDPLYNQKITKPFCSSHEDLWREDSLYDLILLTNHNTDPIIPGKGSAIFIHITPPDFSSSAGCLTLQKKDLLNIITNCGPELYWEV
ncbi:MAG: L,D-transpeptidase family protein [Candidatus Paracaedibacteraceae bacterium]|nr:L,D-transpeptidase family protein [Candidatus Paracaedibacteraceae bacterium]